MVSAAARQQIRAAAVIRLCRRGIKTQARRGATSPETYNIFDAGWVQWGLLTSGIITLRWSVQIRQGDCRILVLDAVIVDVQQQFFKVARRLLAHALKVVELLHQMVAALADAFKDQLGLLEFVLLVLLQPQQISGIAANAAEIFFSQIQLAGEII